MISFFDPLKHDGRRSTVFSVPESHRVTGRVADPFTFVICEHKLIVFRRESVLREVFDVALGKVVQPDKFVPRHLRPFVFSGVDLSNNTIRETQGHVSKMCRPKRLQNAKSLRSNPRSALWFSFTSPFTFWHGSVSLSGSVALGVGNRISCPTRAAIANLISLVIDVACVVQNWRLRSGLCWSVQR